VSFRAEAELLEPERKDTLGERVRKVRNGEHGASGLKWG